MRGENGGHESDSSDGSCEEVQSSGNSSLNLSDEEENIGPNSVLGKNWNTLQKLENRMNLQLIEKQWNLDNHI